MSDIEQLRTKTFPMPSTAVDLGKTYPESMELDLYYSKGGHNYFDHSQIKRGVWLSFSPLCVIDNGGYKVTRRKLPDPRGGKLLLEEQKRKSAKVSQKWRDWLAQHERVLAALAIGGDRQGIVAFCDDPDKYAERFSALYSKEKTMDDGTISAILDISSGMIWEFRNGGSPEGLGLVPGWFSAFNEDPAVKQANDGYMRTAGCSFTPFAGHVLRLNEDTGDYELEYPGDPASRELARTFVNGAHVVLFEGEWMAIFEDIEKPTIARVD